MIGDNFTESFVNFDFIGGNAFAIVEDKLIFPFVKPVYTFNSLDSSVFLDFISDKFFVFKSSIISYDWSTNISKYKGGGKFGELAVLFYDNTLLLSLGDEIKNIPLSINVLAFRQINPFIFSIAYIDANNVIVALGSVESLSEAFLNGSFSFTPSAYSVFPYVSSGDLFYYDGKLLFSSDKYSVILNTYIDVYVNLQVVETYMSKVMPFEVYKGLSALDTYGELVSQLSCGFFMLFNKVTDSIVINDLQNKVKLYSKSCLFLNHRLLLNLEDFTVYEYRFSPLKAAVKTPLPHFIEVKKTFLTPVRLESVFIDFDFTADVGKGYILIDTAFNGIPRSFRLNLNPKISEYKINSITDRVVIIIKSSSGGFKGGIKYKSV